MPTVLVIGMLLVLLAAAPVTTANAGVAVLVDTALTPCRPVGSGTPIVATVQEGVDLAAPGDRIGICPGVYAGGVIIEKPGITLEGFGAARISGPSAGTGILIVAGEVTIRTLDISGFEGCAILVSGAERVSLLRNELHGNGNGICLSESDESEVRYNTVRANTNSGIEASFSSRVTIANNTVSSNQREGIFGLEELNDSAIDHNLVTGNLLRGIIVQRSAHTSVTTNTVRNNFVGIVAFLTDHAVIDHNRVTRNGLGIVLSTSTHCRVSSNAVVLTNTVNEPLIGNASGLGAFSIDDCLITHNTVHRGRGDGIVVADPGPGIVVSFNAASGNVTPLPFITAFDCVLFLEGGTPPTFAHNVCGTENPPGVW